jgi:uncharacterized protein with FMN-binding domain
MTTDRRPSRIPIRGSLVLAVTIGGLALLMGFRTPEDPADVALAIEPGPEGSSPRVVSDSAASIAASPAASASPMASASPSPSAMPTFEPTASASASLATTQTATGGAFQFRFGVVQVAVTVQGGDIIDVQALQLPDGDRRSLAISQQVEPMLREEALAVDSAAIDVVSGATYTSMAYAYSLQSALDQLAAG